MRSISITLLLAFIALITLGIAAVRIHEGDLTRVFGAPITAVGDTLYDFEPQAVREIILTGNTGNAHCILTDEGWRMISPWQDRMDPRVVQALIGFTLGSRVEGAIPTDQVESTTLGFEDGRIAVRIADADNDPLAKFILGQRTAWMGTDPESGESIPTVFVEPRDRSRKDYIYASTDAQDIHAVLNDGFSRLRDHHPFLFHPNIVESLRVKNRHGELLLSRDSPEELWRIVKPLELKADRESLLRLLQGLYDLRAVNVLSRSEVTLPADDDAASAERIALRFFGQETETVLEIFAPESSESPTVLARVSDRPDTVFELPRTTVAATKDSRSLVGLSDLPRSVNELRDSTLTALDVRQLRTIQISPATSDDVLVTRNTPQARFRVRIDGRFQEPNEVALFSLLNTMTESKVADFVSDTATDLSRHGLDTPFLSLRFIAFDESSIEIDFGQAPDGSIRAIRSGTTTVVEIDPATLAMIATSPWEWRDTQLWSLSKPDVVGIERLVADEPPLVLGYVFVTENWTATSGNTDRSAELATDRAERFLEFLATLRVSHWLRPGHEEALAALAAPDLRLTILVKQFDDEGEFAGIERRTLSVAKVSRGAGTLVFGAASGLDNPFLLSADDLEKLGVVLLDVE